MDTTEYRTVDASDIFDRELLARKSARGVAALLAARGIKGERGHSELCPIAHYIRERLDAHVIDVRVYQRDCFIRTVTDNLRVFPPAPIVEFIDRFDDGEFPSLELHSAEEILRYQ